MTKSLQGPQELGEGDVMRQPRILHAAAVVLVTACGGGGTEPDGDPGPTATVIVANDEFRPSTSGVKQGGTVTFTWAAGSQFHNVTPAGGGSLPASGGLPGTHDAPYSFGVVFPQAGTFPYFCSAHGSATSGMHGSVTVVP